MRLGLASVRAYPEFETFSMNIDGLFSYIADAGGVTEQILDMPIYHLEHEIGSGWSPEGEAKLRKRIAESGITWLDATTVYIWSAYMRWLARPMIFNGRDWGLANLDLLAETAATATGVGVADCRRYLAGLDYALSYKHLAGLTDFFRRLAAHGLVPDGSLQFLQVA